MHFFFLAVAWRNPIVPYTNQFVVRFVFVLLQLPQEQIRLFCTDFIERAFGCELEIWLILFAEPTDFLLLVVLVLTNMLYFACSRLCKLWQGLICIHDPIGLQFISQVLPRLL